VKNTCARARCGHGKMRFPYGLPVLNSQRRGQGDILLFLLVGRNERSRKDVTGGGGGNIDAPRKKPVRGRSTFVCRWLQQQTGRQRRDVDVLTEQDNCLPRAGSREEKLSHNRSNFIRRNK